jgi:hypothetical protein
MATVKVCLKDPSTVFEQNGKTLSYRSVMEFEKTEKVQKAIRAGILQVVKEKAPNEVVNETIEQGFEKQETLKEEPKQEKPSKK